MNQAETMKDNEFLKYRAIVFEGKFNEVNCKSLKEQLLYLLSQNEKEDITIYISSDGGGIYHFLKVYGLIKTAKCKINTIALGHCMSAGAYLLLLGDKRYAYPETRIMLHEVAWDGSYKKLHDKQKEFKEAEELQNILFKIVKERTKIKNIKEYLKDEQFMSPETAKKLGVIDEVLQ